MTLLISKLFCRKGCLSCHFRAQKKSRFSGPAPANDPCNGSCPHQNHYVPGHTNNRYHWYRYITVR
jgi:hypothetical protein